MKLGVKIICTILIIVIGTVLALICQPQGKASFIPILFIVGAVFGVIGIWKKREKSENTQELDKYKLDKE